MPRKDRVKRQVDTKADVQFGDGEIISEAVSTAGAAIYIPQSIDTLEFIGQGVFRSASTPTIAVDIAWQHPDGEIPQDYIIEYAEDDDFTLNRESFIAYGLTAVLYLKPDTDYWVHVAPRIRTIQSDWSNVITFTTMEDTIIPTDVDNVAADFINSNLIITWDQPSDEAYKNARIRIWDSTRTTLYETYYQRDSPFILTAAENRRIGLGTPQTDVSVDVTSNSWGNRLGANPQIVSVVAPLPDTPTSIVHSWISDDGTADEDVTFSWANAVNAFDYVLTLDTKDIVTKTPFVIYPYLNNIADHTPTLASGDYNLAYSLIARDLLDQESVPATGNAINAAPPDVFGTVDVTAGFSSLGIIISPAVNILDFSHYNFEITDGTTTITFSSPDNIQTVDLDTSGTYDVSVTAVDKYNQSSAAIEVTDIIVDALTIDELRAETTYSDSISTSPTTLDGLKDGNTATNVVTYAASSSYKWTQAARPQLDRYKVFSDSHQSALGIPVMTYFATSVDGSTWRWFSGPLAFTGSTGQATTLVERADQATAETNALSLVTNVYRFDLPSIVEARFIRIYHKSANDYSYREFYPRRLVQSDDMEAETIKGINVQAAAINAGHISVTTLGAITTSTGTLIINTSGYLRSGQTAYNTGTGFYLGNDSGTPKFSVGNSAGTYFTWDGTNLVLNGGNFTIQTASSAQRIVIDSNGVSGYNSAGTLQVRMQSSDGAVSAGGGDTLLNADGLILNANTSVTYNRPKSIKWRDTVNSEDVANIRGWYSSTLHNIYIEALTNGGSTKNGRIVLQANGTGPDAIITLLGDSSESSISIDAGITTITSGLNIGSATGATIGQIRSSAAIGSATTITAGSTTVNDGQMNSRSSADTKLVLTDTRAYSNGTARILDIHFKANNPDTVSTFNSATIRAEITPSAGISTPASELSFWTTNNSTGPGKRVTITGTGDILPGVAGTQNLGNATFYWNDISYKTITDRGCIAVFDKKERIEMTDGVMVTAIEALRSMRKHGTKKTPYNKDRADYNHVPKIAHKPATKDTHGNPLGEDGIEMTAMFSIYQKAITELADENEELRQRVLLLEGRK